MSITSALESGTVTVRPVRGSESAFEVVSGGDRVALISPDQIELGERRLELREGRGHHSLVDVERDATVATIQRRAHGSSAIAVGTARFRLVKEHVIPISFQVTEDFAGPQIVRAAKIGSMLRFRAGKDMAAASSRDVDLLVAAVSVILLKIDVPSEAAA